MDFDCFEVTEIFEEWLKKKKKENETVYTPQSLEAVEEELQFHGLYSELSEVVCSYLTPECATEELLHESGMDFADLRSPLRALYADTEFETDLFFLRAVQCHVIGPNKWEQFLVNYKRAGDSIVTYILRRGIPIPVPLLKAALPQTEEKLADLLRIRNPNNNCVLKLAIYWDIKSGDYWRLRTLKAICPPKVLEELKKTRCDGRLVFHQIIECFVSGNFGKVGGNRLAQMLTETLPPNIATETDVRLQLFVDGSRRHSYDSWIKRGLGICKPKAKAKLLRVLTVL